MLESIQKNANGRKLQANTEAISWHLLASFLFNFRMRLRLKQIDGIGPTLRSRGWTRQAAKSCQGVPLSFPRSRFIGSRTADPHPQQPPWDPGHFLK